jgi:hypothetical protein
LPSHAASVDHKLQRYQQFVYVIDRIIERHPPSRIKGSYRHMDKALMVLGATTRPTP